MHYITFCHLGWARLFIFITKNPKVIFLATVRPFHTKSEINKPQAEEDGLFLYTYSQFLLHGDRKGVSE